VSERDEKMEKKERRKKKKTTSSTDVQVDIVLNKNQKRLERVQTKYSSPQTQLKGSIFYREEMQKVGKREMEDQKGSTRSPPSFVGFNGDDPFQRGRIGWGREWVGGCD